MSLKASLRSFGAIFRRDAAALRMLPIAGLVIGLIAPLSVFLPVSVGRDPFQVRDMLALTTTTVLVFSALGVLGARVVVRDYIRGQVAFYLSRPIHVGVLWLGKLSAILVSVGVAGGLALLPTLIVGGSPIRGTGGLELLRQLMSRFVPSSEGGFGHGSTGLEGGWLILLMLALITLATGHFIAVMVGLRSAWTVADLVVVGGIALVAAGTYNLGRELMADRAVSRLVLTCVAALIAALMLGGWAQLRWAGVSAVRAHGIQSVMLWLSLAMVVLPQAWQMSRLSAITLDRLDKVISVRLAQEGPWASVVGLHEASGYRPEMLLNLDTGRRLLQRAGGPRGGWALHPQFSGNGKMALLSECASDRPCQLRVLDLDSFEGSVIDETSGSTVALVPDGQLWRPKISYHGDLLWLPTGDLTSGRVVRVASGRTLFELALPADQELLWSRLGHEDRLVVGTVPLDGRGRASEARVYWADLRSSTPAFEYFATHNDVVRLGSRDFIVSDGLQGERILDLRRLRVLELPSIPGLIHVRRLSGGRWLLVTVASKAEGQEAAFWQTWREEEGLSKARELVAVPQLVSDEVALDRVLIASGGLGTNFYPLPPEVRKAELGHWRTEVFNVRTGEIEHTVHDLLPVVCDLLLRCEGPSSRAVLQGKDGKLHWLDVTTGEVRPLMTEKKHFSEASPVAGGFGPREDTQ